MRAIRASEFSTYVYCARAWWYRLQGIESANQAEMTAGTEIHRQHGRQVMAFSLIHTLALVLLLVALILLVAFFTMRVI